MSMTLEHDDTIAELRQKGAAARLARAFTGLPHREAAAAFGISVAALTSAENGEPDDTALASIYKNLGGFGISVDLQKDGRYIVMRRDNDPAFTPEQTLATLLGPARRAAGLSQEALSKISNVSQRTIVAMENGDASTLETRNAVFEALYRRRVSALVEGTQNGIILLPPHEPIPPATNLGIPNDTVLARFERTLQARDRSRPDFIHYRAEIVDSDPPIWREFLIPENATFEDMHNTLQVAFSWRNYHLHEFDVGISIGPLNPDGRSAGDPRIFDERLTFLFDVPRKLTFDYRYDFGDSWRCRLTRGDDVPAETRPSRPLIIDGENAGPVEDSGGIDAYNELADDIRKNVLEKDKRSWLVRVGYRAFNPDHFDAAGANKALAKIPFEIPENWKDQFQLERSIHVSAPHLEARDAAANLAATTPRPIHSLEILKISAWSEKQHKRAGLLDKEGSTYAGMGRDGDERHIRSTAHDAIGYLLNLASDIIEQRSYPIKIDCKVNGKHKSFVPDIELTDKAGKKTFVTVLSLDDIPDEVEYQMLASVMKTEGQDYMIVGNGLGHQPTAAFARELWQVARGRSYPEADAVIRSIIGDRQMSLAEAIDLFIKHPPLPELANFDGPAHLVARRLILNAALGRIIAIKPAAALNDKVVLAPAGTFDKAFALLPLLKKYRMYP